jgi:hypothetical protein
MRKLYVAAVKSQLDYDDADKDKKQLEKPKEIEAMENEGGPVVE